MLRAHSPSAEGARLAQLVAEIADGVLVVDADGLIVFANPAAARILRVTEASLVGVEFGIPHLDDGMVEIDIPGTRRVVEMRVSRGSWDGRPVRITTLRDVTERRRDERERRRLASLVEASDDAIIGLDARGSVESWNSGATALYGYTAAEAVGRPIDELVSPEPRDRPTAATIARMRDGGGVERDERDERRRDGSRVEAAITDSPMRDGDDRLVGLARTARDVGPRRRLERELRFFADHDPHTGLLNRRRLAEEIARVSAEVARYGEPAALVVCDIDNFKLVNDALGHRIGDELIAAVARRLRARLRETDIIARLGGDEFALVLPHTGLGVAHEVADALRVAVHDMTTIVDDHPLRVTMSFGVAAIEGESLSPDDALAVADLAMYEAKHRGRDHVVSARTGPERERAGRVLAWSERLRSALAEDRFELHAQPIVDIATGTAEHHELLLRMREPNGALVLPGAFIPTAERSGMITQIDRWVVARALRLVAADPGGSRVYAVNLSAVSIGDPALLETLDRGIREHGVDPARLIFEITETAAIADMEGARSFAVGLRALGCASALDDFGSGFGSFSYLRYLPIDYLKIDGAFVSQLPGSRNDRLLVKAIVDVAHGLGKRTIAEHVGSDAALRLLGEYGADFAQGHHLGRPRRVGDIRG